MGTLIEEQSQAQSTNVNNFQGQRGQHLAHLEDALRDDSQL